MEIPDPISHVDPFDDFQWAAMLSDQKWDELRRRRRWQACAFVLLFMVAVTLLSL